MMWMELEVPGFDKSLAFRLLGRVFIGISLAVRRDWPHAVSELALADSKPSFRSLDVPEVRMA